MKNIIEELISYRVKVEKDGKEIVNIPSIIAIPGALIAPKVSIVGTVAASLLGCNIHVENDKGTKVDVSERTRKATDTLADTAKTVKEEIDKAWDTISSDDPEERPVANDPEGSPVANDPEGSSVGEQKAAGEEPVAENIKEIVKDLKKQDNIPTIQVNPENSTEA